MPSGYPINRKATSPALHGFSQLKDSYYKIMTWFLKIHSMTNINISFIFQLALKKYSSLT